MHLKFSIYRTPDEPCDVLGQPILEYDNAFDACMDCIRAEQQSGRSLKYEVRVTEAARASKEKT